MITVRPARAEDAEALPQIEQSAGESFLAIPELAWLADGDNISAERHRVLIADGSVVRAHQDASGGKGGSKAMLLDALEEVFRPKSTRSSTRKGARSTSR